MSGLRRYESPGKFEGGLVIDEATYLVSLLGCDEEDSCGFSGEWYGLLRGPIVNPDDSGVELTSCEVDYLNGIAGAILFQSSDGFISVTYYETAKAMDKAWDRITSLLVSSDEDDSDVITFTDEESAAIETSRDEFNDTDVENPGGWDCID